MEEALHSYYIAEIIVANSDFFFFKEGCLISSELAILHSDVHFLIWKSIRLKYSYQGSV